MDLKIFGITDKCTACGACVSICPQEALSLGPQEYFGFYYPQVDVDRCVGCGICETICHVINEKVGENKQDRTPFMLKAHDKDLVWHSSSGGAFSLLAEKVLKDDGIVYGAAYNYEEEKLVETSTDMVDICELRKSKYVESYCGNIFKDAESKLRNGRKVMFCGTPCQIKGLSHYLTQKNCPTDQLFLVQFLCHGVPANQFFTEYKHWLEKRCKGKITAMDFRSKKYGWRNNFFYYNYGTGSKTVKGSASYYLSSFNKYYMLRDSCYGCTIFDQGYADLTISDFWGLFRYDPQNKDNEGISLLIAHNDKAKKAVEDLKDVAMLNELPLSAIDYTRKPHRHVRESLETKRMMEREIVQYGYMPYMKRILKKSVRMGIIKDRISKILFTLKKWKINK